MVGPQQCTALLAVLYLLHLVAAVTAEWLVTLHCDCGKNNPDNHIGGDGQSPVHIWPWLVAIHIQSTWELHCGGSLISTTWIMTAAHCIANYEVNDFVVSIGEYDRWTWDDVPFTQYRNINQMIIHPAYDRKPDQFLYLNDIAVIQLSGRVQYNHGISPVCLPTNLRTQMFVGEDATVTGWGQTAKNLDSDTVIDTTLSIIPNTECQEKLPFRISDDQICAYDEEKSVCRGYSGGPMVWLDDSGHYQQIGIVSWGKDCAYPSVYTRVTSYIPWIEEHTNISFCAP